MDIWQKIVLSIIGIVIGFFVSQSFNIIKYYRRPRFKISNMGNGVISSYSGGEDGEPAEVVLGFHLGNIGYNAAVNSRVFISDLLSAEGRGDELKDGYFVFSELMRPIDIIPPGESARIVFGEMNSDEKYLEIPFLNKGNDDLGFYVRGDTKGKKYFSAKFYVICDNTNSFSVFDVLFSPGDDEYGVCVFD